MFDSQRKNKKTAVATTEEGEAPADATPAAEAPKKRTKRRAPRAPRADGEDPVGEPSKTMLFVANLGFSIDDAGLSTLFTDAGINVVSARIIRRRWGQPRKSKGYGFVEVSNEEEQKKAMEKLEGKDVGGRTIAVKIAVKTSNVEEVADAIPEAIVEDAIPEAIVVAT